MNNKEEDTDVLGKEAQYFLMVVNSRKHVQRMLDGW
jgi:hypothetical protein